MYKLSKSDSYCESRAEPNDLEELANYKGVRIRRVMKNRGSFDTYRERHGCAGAGPEDDLISDVQRNAIWGRKRG